MAHASTKLLASLIAIAASGFAPGLGRLAAHHLERRFAALDRVGRPARDDHELARGGGVRTAEDGRGHQRLAGLGVRGRERLDGRGAVGAHRHVNAAPGHRLPDAASTERHVVQRGIVGHHADDDVAVAAGVSHACGASCARLFEIRRFSRRSIENEQVVPAAQEPLTHALAHAAQTDQTNLHERLR